MALIFFSKKCLMFQKTYFSLQRQNEKHLRLNEAKEFWKKNLKKFGDKKK
jgi:hypothetical protein